MDNIFRDIKNIKLSTTDQYILSKINENYEKFLDLSISEFAKHVPCSISALSRLSKRLGFKNYTMLKIYISSMLSQQDNIEVASTIDFSNQKMQDLGNAYIETIKMNMHKNKQVIKKLSLEIIRSKKVLGYGSGSSFLPLSHLMFNLEQMGFDCYSEANFHKTLHILKANHHHMVVLLFSKQLQTKEIQFLLKVCSELNIQTYIFTTNKNVTRIKRENIIVFEHLEQKDRKFSISSKIAELYYVDLIMLYVLESLEDKTFNNYKIIKKWNEFK